MNTLRNLVMVVMLCCCVVHSSLAGDQAADKTPYQYKPSIEPKELIALLIYNYKNERAELLEKLNACNTNEERANITKQIWLLAQKNGAKPTVKSSNAEICLEAIETMDAEKYEICLQKGRPETVQN